MKILVIGGAGFVGRHVVKGLCPNHDITVVDKKWVREENRIESVRYINLNLIYCNFSFYFNDEYDVVINLAAISTVNKNSYDTLNNNIKVVLNSLELFNCPHIFSTSDKVLPAERNVHENSTLTGNLKEPYRASKVIAELVIHHYRYQRDNLHVARFGNIYGPNDHHEDRLIPSIFNYYYRNYDAIDLRTDGTPVRSFIFIADVVKYIRTMIDFIGRGIKLPKFSHFATSSHSVLDVIHEAENVIGEKFLVSLGEGNPDGEVDVQTISCDKTFDYYGFKPTYNLNYGLTCTNEWYKEKYTN